MWVNIIYKKQQHYSIMILIMHVESWNMVTLHDICGLGAPIDIASNEWVCYVMLSKFCDVIWLFVL